MSNKKHKKRKAKGRPRDPHSALARARVGQTPSAPAVPTRQAPQGGTGRTTVGEGIGRRLRPDLRRAFLSAAIVLLVLAILYLVLR